MQQRHFSMLREFHLADWFTLGNAFCGSGAIFAAMRFLQDGDVPWLLAGMAGGARFLDGSAQAEEGQNGHDDHDQADDVDDGVHGLRLLL